MGGAPRSDLESPGDLCAPPHRFGVASVRRFGMGSITVNVRPGVEGGTGRAATGRCRVQRRNKPIQPLRRFGKPGGDRPLDAVGVVAARQPPPGGDGRIVGKESIHELRFPSATTGNAPEYRNSGICLGGQPPVDAFVHQRLHAGALRQSSLPLVFQGIGPLARALRRDNLLGNRQSSHLRVARYGFSLHAVVLCHFPPTSSPGKAMV
jgi:hypothetical protein